MGKDEFVKRHNGPRQSEVEKMLKVIGTSSIDGLIDETVPASIRLKQPLNLPEGMSEFQYMKHIKEIASKNKKFRTFIGMGYYSTITPNVILRNIFENPGWYTAYTPYQAEISQGRLEAVLNFQTVISDLTGFPIANASLLDEATAAAEAMLMLFNSRSRDAVKKNANKFFVSRRLFPQTIDVLKTRAEPMGIELLIGCHDEFKFDEKTFGSIVQYPAGHGEIYDYTEFVKKSHTGNCPVVVVADILSLALLTPPAEFGADVAVGSTQRLGIPLSYGGPSAAYFATKEEFKRSIPGRIIGISVDAQGNKAFRMAIQTREQHIKREKATSNICTSQVLLAVMAGMYAVYHGKCGIKKIAEKIHKKTSLLNSEITKLGYTQENEDFFDTLRITMPSGVSADEIKKNALAQKINLYYADEKTIWLSLDEATTAEEINTLIEIFAKSAKRTPSKIECSMLNSVKETLPNELIRKSSFLENEVFNSFHSETEMMRYIKKLENKDLALNRTMIPLGSCTMKLNAATEMLALSWDEFGNVHPFAPAEQTEGYNILIKELEKDLCEITGFAAISLQPNSGAQGEYAGLMVIRHYLKAKGQSNRNIVLIPASAHGTNPASAVMAGMQVVVVKCDAQGNIDTNDLKEQATKHKDNLAALMVTYPSTHGVFEESIIEINNIIHQNGGQVYMDGANMNAQVGLTSPATIGADVCHLNLHKTFAIPHGGGGPGVGPIGVAKHLVEFLPSHSVVKVGGEKGHAVSASPYGSALVLTISYAYIKMMGGKGLTEATKYAILNANYIKSKLEKYYPILYTGTKGRVAHEMILDCNSFKKDGHIEAIDIAKRLMDYGFHAPTVAFPVHGTLMVEPTESEPLAELDRFCEAMLSIRNEIDEIEKGTADITDNVIKNSPHTVNVVANSEWNHKYSREKAAFPVKGLHNDKYWTVVSRIDDAFGDRNLVCTCSNQ
ncbi:MAG: aminomethyl-transferring glycine dehydrogenase [Bacteroidales bacterium]|jgi:glycine dehydrogenase